MTQFQNCAPAGSAIETAQVSDPEMRIVDDWAEAKVSIVNKVMQASSTETSINVDGFCDRRQDVSEPMRWQVSMPEAGEAIMAGAVGCERGGFRVQISELNQLRCGTAYNVEVSTLNGETDQAVLIRQCAL